MSNLDVFRDEYLPNAQGSSTNFANWKKNYPAEHTAWVAYRDQVLAGNLPQPPTMVSKYGKALAAAGHMAERDDMKVTLSTNMGTVDLEGSVVVTAAPSTGVTRVDFYIDDVLKSPSDTSSPYTYSWDTTTVADGWHQLKAVAFYPRNKKAEGKLDVTVKNTSPDPDPDPPPSQDPPVNTEAPSISGTATQGQTLTVIVGAWTNEPTGYSRQWLRCDVAGANPVLIPSATGVTYLLAAADVGATIRCAVTAFNAIGASAQVQTAQTGVVQALAPAVPVSTGALPGITGTVQRASTLTCSTGGWTNSPTSYTYQWQRCNSSGASCVNISGATANSYLLALADVGSTIRCQVKGVNASGAAATAASSAVTVVVANTPPPPPTVIKTLNSQNAYPVGLSSDSAACSLIRPSGFGEQFDLQSTCVRCTWTNTAFSDMGRHEVFDIDMRWDSRPAGGTSWEQIIMLRPHGSPWGNVNCASGGNSETMLLRLWIDPSPTPDTWMLDIRGGSSVNLSDQVVTRLNLGPVVQGEIINFKFDIVSHYLNGAASVWKNNALVYENRNRPLGFHYDCNRSTDVSGYALRMQHGVYRGGGGAVKLTSSGFRFTVSEA